MPSNFNCKWESSTLKFLLAVANVRFQLPRNSFILNNYCQSKKIQHSASPPHRTAHYFHNLPIDTVNHCHRKTPLFSTNLHKQHVRRQSSINHRNHRSRWIILDGTVVVQGVHCKCMTGGCMLVPKIVCFILLWWQDWSKIWREVVMRCYALEGMV